MVVMGDEWNFNRQALEQAVRAFALEARFTELLELRRALMGNAVAISGGMRLMQRSSED